MDFTKAAAQAIIVGAIAFAFFYVGNGMKHTQATITAPDPVTMQVQIEPVVKSDTTDKVMKTMVVSNQEGSLSRMTFISKHTAYTKLFSSITVGDVTSFWNDIYILNDMKIKNMNLFINSPGGDAFSGLALADQIRRAQRMGFTIRAHASGIVASAAVPILAVCSERYAAEGTIFMIHEAAIWKWPGLESASDIRAQNELMKLLKDRYIEILASKTHLTKEQWEEKEAKTTWFNAENAYKWGLVDAIR